MASHNLVVQFNPAKLDAVGQSLLREVWSVVGFDRLFVEEFHAAFDYDVPRRAVLLDDRKRKGDAFGIGAKGAESWRTGYRKGSMLRQQVYDKTAERRAAGADARGHVTRFEVQQKRDDQYPLSGLGAVEFPADADVRVLPWHPGRIASIAHAGMAALAISHGVRFAIAWAREQYGWRQAKIADAVEQLFPVIQRSPVDAWSKWPEAVAVGFQRAGIR
jgi:hypothetical protein